MWCSEQNRGAAPGSALSCAPHRRSTIGAQQLSWLLNDLARVDRTKTPWVIVAWHQPPVSAPPRASIDKRMCPMRAAQYALRQQHQYLSAYVHVS